MSNDNVEAGLPQADQVKADTILPDQVKNVPPPIGSTVEENVDGRKVRKEIWNGAGDVKVTYLD